MALERNKKQWWQYLLFFLISPLGMGHIHRSLMKTPQQKKREEEKEKAIMRNFKVEVQSSFWGTKIKYVQREIPLTDEELELMYKEKGSTPTPTIIE